MTHEGLLSPGMSMVINPEMQVSVPSMSGILSTYFSAGTLKACPPKVRCTSGGVLTVSQSRTNSPNSAGVAPSILFSGAMSLSGPPIRLVPESTIAKQPPRQKLPPVLGMETLSMVTLKKPCFWMST